MSEKKEKLKKIAFEKKAEAEKAMYNYACACELGKEREGALYMHDKIMEASRTTYSY